MTADPALRRRLHDEIVAAIERDPAAVAEFAGLSEVDQAWYCYHRALDALARSGCAGFAPPLRQRLALVWERKQAKAQL